MNFEKSGSLGKPKSGNSKKVDNEEEKDIQQKDQSLEKNVDQLFRKSSQLRERKSKDIPQDVLNLLNTYIEPIEYGQYPEIRLEDIQYDYNIFIDRQRIQGRSVDVYDVEANFGKIKKWIYNHRRSNRAAPT